MHRKQSHYSPGQALRVPGSWGSHISRQSAHEGGKVVSSMHWPPLPPRKYSCYSFLLEAESTPGPKCGRKDYINEKIPVTPSGIEPATFRLVAQCPKSTTSPCAPLNPLNAELNPIYHLLALLGGATIVVVSRLRVNISIPRLNTLFLIVSDLY